MKPQRIGRYLTTDEHGFLLPDVAIENMKSPWREAVDFVTGALLARGAKAVYLRGSVPRGLAIEGVSDLDFLYLEGPDAEQAEEELFAEFEERFPFVDGLELIRFEASTLSQVFPPQTRPYFQMLLKTQSLFLAGRDIAREIAPFKMDVNLCSHVYTIEKEFAQLSDWLAEADDEEDLRATRRWFFRRLVRAGAEICVPRTGRFTRDLYLCYEDFAQLYPEQGPAMERALEGAVSGLADPLAEGALVAMVGAERARLG
ncbi:MAG: hypothetical protein EOP11_19820 [Proteobacteria bacterium]|nr:MAG: hypothetical protein EOP11_19820 [Pseudomonadota bacterium]